MTAEARTKDGPHKVEVIPIVIDLPDTKNKVAENHLPADDENQAAKNQRVNNLEEGGEGREFTAEALTLELKELLFRKCEGNILKRGGKEYIVQEFNVCMHTLSRLWKLAMECL